jgi:hypothetical protein
VTRAATTTAAAPQPSGKPAAARATGRPARLVIGAANDPAEREADTLAARLLAGEAVQPRHAAASVARKCAACEEETKVRREGPNGEDVHAGQPAPPSVASLMAEPGRALDPAVRSRLDAKTGGLGDVRIHDSAAADTAARAIGARAFTVGNRIAFAGGAYRPGTDAGKQLLAHELVHVMQNRDAPK